MSLLLGRHSKGLDRSTLLVTHLSLHARYVLRALIGRSKKPITNVRIGTMRASAPSIDAIAFLLQTVYMRRDYEIACDKKSPIIIDCGSNIGLSILSLKSRYPDARIIAFAPNPAAFGYLQRNVQANNLTDVSLNQCAVASKDETRVFFSDADDDGALGASLTDRLREKTDRRVVEQSVQCVTLSSFITKPVDFLKIDVEGAEQEILENLSDRDLLKQVNEMFVEYHYNECNDGNRLIDILNILENADFDVVVDSKRPPPYPSLLGASYKCNLYAKKRSMGS